MSYVLVQEDLKHHKTKNYWTSANVQFSEYSAFWTHVLFYICSLFIMQTINILNFADLLFSEHSLFKIVIDYAWCKPSKMSADLQFSEYICLTLYYHDYVIYYILNRILNICKSSLSELWKDLQCCKISSYWTCADV